MISVVAAGGVIWRKPADDIEVLLIYRNDMWDLPKGKKEDQESIEACARREVSEEVGIPLPDIEHFLTETSHKYHRNGTQYAKNTHWFSMKTDVHDSFTPQKKEGIKAVKWIEIEQAKQMVGYPNLVKVLDTL